MAAAPASALVADTVMVGVVPVGTIVNGKATPPFPIGKTEDAALLSVRVSVPLIKLVLVVPPETVPVTVNRDGLALLVVKIPFVKVSVPETVADPASVVPLLLITRLAKPIAVAELLVMFDPVMVTVQLVGEKVTPLFTVKLPATE